MDTGNPSEILNGWFSGWLKLKALEERLLRLPFLIKGLDSLNWLSDTLLLIVEVIAPDWSKWGVLGVSKLNEASEQPLLGLATGPTNGKNKKEANIATAMQKNHF